MKTKLVMANFDWLSGQVARNSEPFMRQVFVTGDIEDENRLARQVRNRGTREPVDESMNSQRVAISNS